MVSARVTSNKGKTVTGKFWTLFVGGLILLPSISNRAIAQDSGVKIEGQTVSSSQGSDRSSRFTALARTGAVGTSTSQVPGWCRNTTQDRPAGNGMKLLRWAAPIEASRDGSTGR